MTILSEEMRDFLADEYGAQAALVSAHTGDPGTDGSNEVTGGGYTREAPSWGSASGGQIQATTVFDFPADTITHIGVWNAAETVFLDSYELPFPVVIAVAAQRNVNTTFTVV